MKGFTPMSANLLKNLMSAKTRLPRRKTLGRPGRHGIKPSVEGLEDRMVPSTLTVIGVGLEVLYSANSINQLTVTMGGSQITFHDSDTIDLKQDPGGPFAQIDQKTITGPVSFTANGIMVSNAQQTSLVIDDSADSKVRTTTLTTKAGDSTTGVISGLPSGAVAFQYKDVPNVKVITSKGVNDTVNVLATGGSGATSVVGSASEQVKVGSNGRLTGILAPLFITNPISEATTLSVDDSKDPYAGTTTLSNIATKPAFGSITGLSAPINFRYVDTPNVTISTGTATFPTGTLTKDVVNVQDTAGTGTTTILGNSDETVNVGDGGSLAGILAQLLIQDLAGHHTNLNVDDSADPNVHNGNAVVTLSSFPGIFNIPIGSITGLEGNPVAILYRLGTTKDVTITTGQVAGNVINVKATGGIGKTTITGTAAETVHVVGSAAGLAGLSAPLFINNTQDFTTLTVDDSADTKARNAYLSAAPGSAFGSINGLGGADINYKFKDTNGVTIDTGTNAMDVVNVWADGPYGATLVGDAAETVIVGHNGIVGGVAGGVTVENAGGLSTLTVDDSTDHNMVNLTLSTFMKNLPALGDVPFGVLGYLSGGIVAYQYASTKSVTLLTGPVAGDIVNVQATGGAGPTYIIGSASETVRVGNNSGTLADIGAPLFIENSEDSYASSIRVEDSDDGMVRAAILGRGAAGFGQLTGLGGAAINFLYSGTSNFSLVTGPAVGDVVNVQATGGTGTSIEGLAPETVNVTGSYGSLAYIQAPITLVNTPAFTTLNVDDSHDTASPAVTLNTFGKKRFKQLGSITGLAGLLGETEIDYVLADTDAVYIETGTGNDVVNVMKNTVVPVNLVNGGGHDTVVFSDGAGLAGGTIIGGLGNTLDYHLYSTAVAVDLATGAATGTGGAKNLQDVTAGQAGGSLTGADKTNLWQITGTNAGNVNGVVYAGFQNLTGGAGLDTFQFMSTAGTENSIDGGGAPSGQGDWLDYSLFTTSVTVNLATGSASATNVNDGAPGAVTNIQNVISGSGNDTLSGNGNSQGNILIGHGGADKITGGSGRSLLIGGSGTSAVTGGSGGDILIAGTTSYDITDHLALMSILAEWQSADPLATRFDDINTGTGGGLNGTNKLNDGTTVINVATGDSVLALPGSSLNWFFDSSGDTDNWTNGQHKNNT
jgi:hypothetical protein